MNRKIFFVLVVFFGLAAASIFAAYKMSPIKPEVKSFLVQVGEPTSKDSRCIMASVLVPSNPNFSNRTEIRFEVAAVADCKELSPDGKTAILYAEESNVAALASK